MDKKSKDLIIVESPTQAKSVQSLVGDQYKVVATKGHILRSDLRASNPDPKNDFTVRLTFKNKDILNNIIQEARDSEKIYIATDPDEEGETIALHLEYLLREMTAKIYRVILREISAVQVNEALQSPVTINSAVVKAQEARSAIDQMIGTQISPVLTKIYPFARSAGRVQSAAMILLLENETRPVQPASVQLHNIELSFKSNHFLKGNFFLYKVSRDSKDIPLHDPGSEFLKQLSQDSFTISEISIIPAYHSEKGYLNTGKLLQEGIRRFKRTGRQIMKTAQQLYEGIETKNHDWLNLITYPRTDAVSVSVQFQQKLVDFLLQNGINVNLKNFHWTKDNHAHSAITPVRFSQERTPAALKSKLSHRQFELYNLIWNWSLAATLYGTGNCDKIVKLDGKKYQLWLRQDLQMTDSGAEYWNNSKFPEGLMVQTKYLKTTLCTDFDYSIFDEAHLINVLDKNGIGRPSTYAEIVPLLLKRKYIELHANKISLTDLGRKVAAILSHSFSNVVGVPVSKRLEMEIKSIATNKKYFLPVIQEFKSAIDRSIAQFQAQSIDGLSHNAKICPLCGEPLIKRHNRNGILYVCNNHPNKFENIKNLS